MGFYFVFCWLLDVSFYGSCPSSNWSWSRLKLDAEQLRISSNGQGQSTGPKRYNDRLDMRLIYRVVQLISFSVQLIAWRSGVTERGPEVRGRYRGSPFCVLNTSSMPCPPQTEADVLIVRSSVSASGIIRKSNAFFFLFFSHCHKLILSRTEAIQNDRQITAFSACSSLVVHVFCTINGDCHKIYMPFGTVSVLRACHQWNK